MLDVGSAGLFLQSLRNTQVIDPGFDKNMLLAGMDLFANGYTPDRGRVFYDQLLERVRALPGVEAASLGRRLPLGLGVLWSQVDARRRAWQRAPWSRRTFLPVRWRPAILPAS